MALPDMIVGIAIGLMIGGMIITLVIFSIVPDRYESLVDAMDCNKVGTYLNGTDGAGIVVTELVEQKIIDCR